MQSVRLILSRSASSSCRQNSAKAARLLTSGETTLVIDLDGVDDIAVSRAEAAARIAFGALLRGYRFDKYRTKLTEKQKPTLEEIVILNAGSGAAEALMCPCLSAPHSGTLRAGLGAFWKKWRFS